jgi:hypothetical protein
MPFISSYELEEFVGGILAIKMKLKIVSFQKRKVFLFKNENQIMI